MTDMPHIAENAIKQWKISFEQERMQKALAEREAQFRLLAENSSDMISRHDVDGNFLYVSPACHTLLGYTPEELIGLPVITLVHPDDVKQIMDLLTSSKWDDPTAAIPYRARHKNGVYIY
jgi:PAS domain S-box-containing protein